MLKGGLIGTFNHFFLPHIGNFLFLHVIVKLTRQNVWFHLLLTGTFSYKKKPGSNFSLEVYA